MKHKIYNVFLVVFTFLFASIIMGTIFDNKSLISNVSTISIIIGTIFVGLIIFILYKYLISKLLNISLKKEIIIVTILLSIIIIIQCLVFYYFNHIQVGIGMTYLIPQDFLQVVMQMK